MTRWTRSRPSESFLSLNKAPWPHVVTGRIFAEKVCSESKFGGTQYNNCLACFTLTQTHLILMWCYSCWSIRQSHLHCSSETQTYYHVSGWNLWLFRFKLQSMSFIKCSKATIWYYQIYEEQNLILQKGICWFLSCERKCPDVMYVWHVCYLFDQNSEHRRRHCPQIH